MMQVIGIKRFIVLVLLVSVNAALGGALYMYTIPERDSSERTLRAIRSQVNTLRSDIDRMQIEFEQLDQQQERFDALKASGFFSIQVRSDAKELFSTIQDESKVISTVVSVKPGIIINDAEAQKAKHKVLMSPIEIDIDSFDDASIYKYLEFAQARFPGHLSLDGITVKRSQDISSPVLRSIASGSNPSLVSAEILLSWRTIIPESKVISSEKKP